jgi:O-antigen ligase
MAAISIAVLLHARSLRWKFLLWSSVILVFWAADGFIQLIFGYDLFGIPAHKDRLNALFFTHYQFYGPVMAMLSPLLLEYARRHWPGWAWAGAFALVMGAVMIAGMRSGWLAMAMVIAVYGILMLRRENRELRRVTLTIPAIAIIVIAVSYAISPLFQERVATTLAITSGTEEAVDLASSLRVPIFRNSLRMYEAHPVNGVGVRAFSVAYLEFADPDDPHVAASNGEVGARHAHNVVLEVMADTGTIGLLGWLAGVWFAWRRWRAMTPDQRQEAFPFVLALGLVLFPLNTHFSIYGTYLSSMIWVLVGLWLSAVDEPARGAASPVRASAP